MPDFLSTPHTFEALAQESLRCLQESEWAKNEADARRAHLRDQVVSELRERYHRAGRRKPLMKGEVERLLNKRAGEDNTWKAKVNLNRWMIDRSTMYSSAALVLAEWERRANSNEG